MGIILVLLATALSFFNVHSGLISKQILKWFNRLTIAEKKLLSQKFDLKKKQSTVSVTEHFALYSKLQRQINKIDEELSEYSSGKNSLAVHFGFTYGTKFLLSLLLLCMSVYFRSTPIIILDEDIDLRPLNYLISYPNGRNTVSFHFWIMCSSAAASLVRL